MSVTADSAPPAPAKRKRSRRWLRLLLPYLVVVLLLVLSGIAYALEDPDQKDPDFLSPVSTAPLGSSKLADRLRSAGIQIERQTRTPAALESAFTGNATLLIPAPDLMHSYYLRMLKLMPATTRVVVIRPSGRTITRGYLPGLPRNERWTAGVESPSCALPSATAAGRAQVHRNEYSGNPAAVTDKCYRGSLLRTRFHATSVTFVGATEPLRNDRIDEVGNSALAIGLLSEAPRLVWLDVHRNEPGPKYLDEPGLDQSPAPAQLGPGKTPDPDFPVPDPHGSDPGKPEPGLPPDDSEAGGGDSGPSLFDLFPATAWAVLALALLSALLAAAARARRISTPVAEPLPVLVPSTETVTGRGRLYARSRDRATAIGVLRSAARTKLARLLDQPAKVDRNTLVQVTATQARLPAEQVEELLYGPAGPVAADSLADDEQLVAAAADLDALITVVTRVPEGEPRD